MLDKSYNLRYNKQAKIFMRGKTMHEDKTLVCKDCGQEFIFTAGEQEFYAEKGFENEPQRCKACRQAKKNARRGERPNITITCTRCGAEAVVHFEPTPGREVLCDECFKASKEA